MKKLYLTFLNEEGKAHNLIPKVAAEELTEDVVREAMEQLRDLDIFDKDGVKLYQDIDSAKYVETIETPLF